MEEFEPDLQVSYKDRVQIIKFNRPTKKNAFGEKTYRGLPKALELAAADTNVSLTILTGAGEYFSSGNDLGGLMSLDGGDFEEIIKNKVRTVRDFVDAIIDYPKILIAVVNGPAIGIAVTLLGLCDVVYASETATFHTPFTSLGISAEGCSTYTFPRIMGQSTASQMLYFNYKMAAGEAKQCGFVAEVFGKSMLPQLMDRLVSFGGLPQGSLLGTKKVIRSDREKSVLHEVNDQEMRGLEERFKSDDFLEAVVKFTARKSKRSKL